jgi:putative Holliday junction resolvase
MMGMRILALDVGEARVGTAVSDPEERLAVPLEVVERREEETDLRSIAAIARREEAETLVVGLPLSLDGSRGPQARRVEAFARRLAARTSLPVELWDERLSTVQASRYQPERRRRQRGGRRAVPGDAVAAAIILQSFLDARRARALDP